MISSHSNKSEYKYHSLNTEAIESNLDTLTENTNMWNNQTNTENPNQKIRSFKLSEGEQLGKRQTRSMTKKEERFMNDKLGKRNAYSYVKGHHNLDDENKVEGDYVEYIDHQLGSTKRKGVRLHATKIKPRDSATATT